MENANAEWCAKPSTKWPLQGACHAHLELVFLTLFTNEETEASRTKYLTQQDTQSGGKGIPPLLVRPGRGERLVTHRTPPRQFFHCYLKPDFGVLEFRLSPPGSYHSFLSRLLFDKASRRPHARRGRAMRLPGRTRRWLSR